MFKFFTKLIFIGVLFLNFAPAQAAIFPRGEDVSTAPVVPAVVVEPTVQPEIVAPSKALASKITPKVVKVPVIKQQTAIETPSTSNSAESAAPISDKQIVVSLADQDLKYFEGTTLVGEFKISSGLPGTPTPPGEYTILVKKPVVDYKGANYDFKNTKWNLLFKKNVPLNYYIHGAYWHHNFGHPMSHGCINVSYANMEGLYNWADVGTRVSIE